MQNQQDIKSLLQQPQAHLHHHHFSVYPEFQLSGRTGIAVSTVAESLAEKHHSVIADTVSSHNLAFHIENLIQKKHTASGGVVVGEMSQEEIVSSSSVHNNNDHHSTDDHQTVVHDTKPKLIIINDEDDSNNSGGNRR